MAMTVNDPFVSVESGTCRKVARAGFAASYDDIVFASGRWAWNAQQL